MRNKQVTEGHCPRLRTLTHPHPTRTLTRSCLCDSKKITPGSLGPCKRGLVHKTTYSDPSPQLRVRDRSVSATEEKADPTRDRRCSPHQGLQ